MSERKDTTPEELIKWLKDKRIKCDCGHFCSQHNLSNTLIITPDGKVYCHKCYD